MRKLILVSLYLLAMSPMAHAALFDDKEARQQIQDLQKKSDSQYQSTQATLEQLKKTQQALDQRVADLEAAIKGQGLVDLLAQIDRLNQELSRVKGQLEVASHDIETTQQRQKDLYADVDGRVRKLEGGGAVAPAAGVGPAVEQNAPAGATAAPSASDNSAEARDFDAAQALSKAGKHREAFQAFDKFLQSYPNSTRAAEAQYALGYSQFSLKNYKAAIITQQKLVKQHPDSPRAPEASFNIANAQIQLADIDGAKATLRELLAKYPNSEVAPNAKKRLAVLDSIKK